MITLMIICYILFFISFILNLYFWNELYRLKHDNEWLNKDREDLKKQYLELYDRFYDVVITEENGWSVFGSKLKSNIEIKGNKF